MEINDIVNELMEKVNEVIFDLEAIEINCKDNEIFEEEIKPFTESSLEKFDDIKEGIYKLISDKGFYDEYLNKFYTWSEIDEIENRLNDTSCEVLSDYKNLLTMAKKRRESL